MYLICICLFYNFVVTPRNRKAFDRIKARIFISANTVLNICICLALLCEQLPLRRLISLAVCQSIFRIFHLNLQIVMINVIYSNGRI